MTGRLHHLALGARDVAAVAAFYRDALGLKELRRHEYEGGGLRSVWLDLGGAVLMVEHTERLRAEVRGVDAGPFLIAVDAPNGRGAVEAAIAAHGGRVEERGQFTSYARDPEGNRVAVSEFRFEPL